MRETHRMVFDGDWNGGERHFRVRRGQQLELESLPRSTSLRATGAGIDDMLSNILQRDGSGYVLGGGGGGW